MTTERIGPHAVPPAGVADGGAPRATAATGDEQSPSFRALLESLQRFAAPPQAPAEAPADPDALRTAIERVDDDFQQVMDLRRRLEDAFRARTR